MLESSQNDDEKQESDFPANFEISFAKNGFGCCGATNLQLDTAPTTKNTKILGGAKLYSIQMDQPLTMFYPSTRLIGRRFTDTKRSVK